MYAIRSYYDAMTAYLAFKRAEIAALGEADPVQICERYAAVY